MCMKMQLCSRCRLARPRGSAHQKQEGSSHKKIERKVASFIFVAAPHRWESEVRRGEVAGSVQWNAEHAVNTNSCYSCKYDTWAAPLWTFSLQPALLCLRWYHGHLSGANAEKLLVARDEPDTFLVRESMSKPGDFVLSVLTDETSKTGTKRVSHIKIKCQVWTQTQTLTLTLFCTIFKCATTPVAHNAAIIHRRVLILASVVSFLNCWASDLHLRETPTVLLTHLSSSCST